MGDEERVTDEKLAGIAEFFSVSKGPGPDGVSNLAQTAAIGEASEMFRSEM